MSKNLSTNKSGHICNLNSNFLCQFKERSSKNNYLEIENNLSLCVINFIILGKSQFELIKISRLY